MGFDPGCADHVARFDTPGRFLGNRLAGLGDNVCLVPIYLRLVSALSSTLF